MNERYDPKTRILYITLKPEDLKNWPIEMSGQDLEDFDAWIEENAQALVNELMAMQEPVEDPIQDLSQANDVIARIKSKL